MFSLSKCFVIVLVLTPSLLVAQTDLIQIESKEGVIEVKIGDHPFANYNFKETPKPFLYPVYGPDQIRMTRDFPMKDTPGEANDHPHHKSIWIGHEINGLDFWSHRDGSRIVVPPGQLKIDDFANSISANSRWLDADDNLVCTDATTWAFGVSENSRWIDCKLALLASEGPITINDTKEGTVAIRTHSGLRLNADPSRGVTQVFGKALNSKGTKGKEIWGQSASWVLYSGTIDFNSASILILDHPFNLRYPTTWHARDYGLVAANPFGLHAFQGMEKKTGEVRLAKGQSLTLRYRFVFFSDARPLDSLTEQLRSFAPETYGSD